MNRTRLLCLIALLLGPTVGHALEPTPAGDGSADRFVLHNESVHPLKAHVGAPSELRLGLSIEGFAKGAVQVQCAARAPEDLPTVALERDGQAEALPVRAIAFPDGPPMLWITSARSGRAALERVVQSSRAGVQLVHQAPAEVPRSFDALRFADGVLVDGADLAGLEPAQRRALREAVAAGLTLVVGLGAADVSTEALADLATVTLDGTQAVGPALAASLGRASGVRTLRPRGAAHPTLVADGTPVVVEQPLGLGRVRLLAVPFAELEPGPVAAAAFARGPDGVGQALSWLDGAPPLADGAGVAWSKWVWVVLLSVLVLAVVHRRWPRVALALAGPLWLAAFWVPPVDEALLAEQVRVLHVPLDDAHDLVVGTTDLHLGQGGGRTLDAPPGVALEDVRPGGGCLVRSRTHAAWVLDAEPGARRRLVWFAIAPAAQGGAESGALPASPPGPLAGARLLALAPEAVRAPVTAPTVERLGWRAAPAPSTPPAPTVLAAPGGE